MLVALSHRRTFIPRSMTGVLALGTRLMRVTGSAILQTRYLVAAGG